MDTKMLSMLIPYINCIFALRCIKIETLNLSTGLFVEVIIIAQGLSWCLL